MHNLTEISNQLLKELKTANEEKLALIARQKEALENLKLLLDHYSLCWETLTNILHVYSSNVDSPFLKYIMTPEVLKIENVVKQRFDIIDAQNVFSKILKGLS